MIIEVAIPYFARDGYDAVSLRDIARTADVTAPTIYIYFEDKRSLYVAACVECLSRSTRRILAGMGTPETPVARLEAFVRSLASALIEDPDTARLFQRELVLEHSDILALVREQAFVEPFDLLAGLLADASGKPADRADALMTFAVTLGLIQFAQVLGPESPREARFKSDADYLGGYVFQVVAAKIGLG